MILENQKNNKKVSKIHKKHNLVAGIPAKMKISLKLEENS